MPLHDRRDVLQGIGLMLPLSTTGCLGLTTQDSIELEYWMYGVITDGMETERTGAEELLDALGRDDETWVVVRVLMKYGEIKSSDLFRGTQVEANGYTGSMVGLSLVVPTQQKPITSSEENFVLEEGMLALMYYHLDHTVEQAEWLTGGLESKFDSITLIHRGS